MKGNASAYLIVISLFILCFPQIVFGQNITSKFANNEKAFNLSGLYIANNNDKYFLKQIGNSVWWIGTDNNESLIKNVFKGTIAGNIIVGQWIDKPLDLTSTNGGSNNFTINLNSKNVTISRLFSSDNFAVTQLNRVSPPLNNSIHFMVSLNNINVIIPRAPLYDVLAVGVSAKKDSGDPITSTNYLGTRDGNSNISLNLNAGPFEMNQNDKGITVEFIGLNKENVEVASTLINIKEILTQLFDPSFNSFDLSNPDQGDVTIRSLSPDLHLYACNGLVFADKIFIPKEELIKSFNNGTTFSRENIYTGSKSPTGCGPNSEYQIKWSIVPIK